MLPVHQGGEVKGHWVFPSFHLTIATTMIAFAFSGIPGVGDVIVHITLRPIQCHILIFYKIHKSVSEIPGKEAYHYDRRLHWNKTLPISPQLAV